MKFRGFNFFILLFLSCSVYAQCSLIEVPFDKKINNSAIVFEGKVISVASFFNHDSTFIYTSNKVEIYKVFKGSYTSGIVDVLTEGGRVNGKMLSVSPSVNFKVGDIGVFMTNPCNAPYSNAFELYSGIQGFIKYDLKHGNASGTFKKYPSIKNDLYLPINKLAGKKYIDIKSFDVDSLVVSKSNFRTSTTITSLFPTVISAGTNSMLAIRGSGFGATRNSSSVNFKNANDGGETTVQPIDSQYLLWTDTLIKVIVPAYAGTGVVEVDAFSSAVSADTLIIPFSDLNYEYENKMYMINLIGANLEGGITWRMNPNVDVHPLIKESFIRAMKTWSCNSGVNWKLGATSMVNKTLNDNINVVTFDEDDSLAAGTLAVCYNYWNSCDSGSNWYSLEMDMIINQRANWQYGPSNPRFEEYDFESVILHELGHAHQLGHVNDLNDVMNFSIFNGETKRHLNANNLAASEEVINRSTLTQTCGNDLHSPLNSSSCDQIYVKEFASLYTVYPNPSSGFISVKIPDKKQKMLIECYNSNGELVRNYNIAETESYISLDLSELVSGMYFLVFNNYETVASQKVLISHFK